MMKLSKRTIRMSKLRYCHRLLIQEKKPSNHPLINPDRSRMTLNIDNLMKKTKFIYCKRLSRLCKIRNRLTLIIPLGLTLTKNKMKTIDKRHISILHRKQPKTMRSGSTNIRPLWLIISTKHLCLIPHFHTDNKVIASSTRASKSNWILRRK